MDDLFSEEARKAFAPKPRRASDAATAAAGAGEAAAGRDAAPANAVGGADGRSTKHKGDKKSTKSKSGAGDAVAAAADASSGGGGGGASRVGEEEADSRTVFVGNVPTATKEGELKKLFSPFGKVASVRRRSIPITGAKVRVGEERKCAGNVVGPVGSS